MNDLNHDNKFEEVTIGVDEGIYTTGVVCRIIKIPLWVLKQLDREGIVRPQRPSCAKARLYSKRELKKVQHCWYYLHERGVKVKALKVILELEQTRGGR